MPYTILIREGKRAWKKPERKEIERVCEAPAHILIPQSYILIVEAECDARVIAQAVGDDFTQLNYEKPEDMGFPIPFYTTVTKDTPWDRVQTDAFEVEGRIYYDERHPHTIIIDGVYEEEKIAFFVPEPFRAEHHAGVKRLPFRIARP